MAGVRATGHETEIANDISDTVVEVVRYSGGDVNPFKMLEAGGSFKYTRVHNGTVGYLEFRPNGIAVDLEFVGSEHLEQYCRIAVDRQSPLPVSSSSSRIFGAPDETNNFFLKMDYRPNEEHVVSTLSTTIRSAASRLRSFSMRGNSGSQPRSNEAAPERSDSSAEGV